MKRVAFTIILNGLHHLKHNDYYKFIIDNFDMWVIAEGAVNSRGSTSWCKKMPENLHNNGRSVDGTFEFLKELSDNPKVEVIISEGLWSSKDEQVNAAIEVIKEKTNNTFLWQIDCDEQWSLENIELAEKTLLDNNLDSAAFPAHSWLGPNIVAKGEWGECINDGYRRLWKWKGQQFKSHEPPLLVGGNGAHAVLPIYFNHYNYYFEQDVSFKDKWYSGHEGILYNWKKLQILPQEKFPLPINNFFNSGWCSNTKTQIVWNNNYV
jgi:hypothetical protein